MSGEDTFQQKKFRLIKPLWFIFGLAFLTFIIVFNYVIVVKKVLFNEAPSIFAIISLAAIAVGIMSFFLAVILSLLKKHSGGNKITFSKVVMVCLTLPVLPIYLLIISLLDKSRGWFSRILRGVIPFVLLLPFWILGYTVLYYVSTDELFLGTRYQVSPIAYSDSMIPTFKPGSIGKYYPYKNIVYKVNPNWAYKINRGDIITFKNETTQSYLLQQKIEVYQDFAKRVIALGGDQVELRAGVVLLNGVPLEEPYTLEPNSTFVLTDSYRQAKVGGLSGLFLEECTTITVPDGKLFVLGDNRKNSNDSRVIGFVDLKDIHGYFPYKEQKTPFKEGVNTINYSDGWRNTSTDLNPTILEKIKNYCN